MKLSSNIFNPDGFWVNPIPNNYIPKINDLGLFDQNGYDLSPLELKYSRVNNCSTKKHRSHRTAIKSPWFTQKPVRQGAHLNHSLLFERKAYQGLALEQLKSWSHNLPLLHKIVAMRPKWGLDFSMDYVDQNGNAFEILHWEWDSFDYEDVQVRKLQVQAKFATIDWDDAGLRMLACKDEWQHLDFFGQSDYKCKYFGVPKEQFKMVLWK
jgi:hypothetical protein